MIADFIWMKTAYYFGREALQDGTYTNLYGYLDAITRIDPQWEAPFLFAGYMIPPFAKDPDGGYELVLSGLDHHDEKWELHFIKAYIEWKEFENLPMAAQSLFDASQREGAPKMLLYLSATLANKASQNALTEMIVRQGLKKLTDETSRKRLLEKLENQP